MEDPVEDTVENTIEDTVENTIKEVKDEDDVKLAAKKLTDSDTYLGSDEDKEIRDDQDGGKDPMNSEDIAKHEPAAFKRDKEQGSSGDPV
jgi:hypothetical protein